jgi:hypothetical protein
MSLNYFIHSYDPCVYLSVYDMYVKYTFAFVHVNIIPVGGNLIAQAGAFFFLGPPLFIFFETFRIKIPISFKGDVILHLLIYFDGDDC